MQPRWILILQDACRYLGGGDQGEDQMGKYSMFQDTYTRTEKYHAWDRADRRSSVRTRRKRTPHREVRSSHEENNTMSETDVPVGKDSGIPLRYSWILNLQLLCPKWKEKRKKG